MRASPLLASMFLAVLTSVLAGGIAFGMTSCKHRAFNASQKSASPAKVSGRPKLVVLVIVDQMRADYVERFRDAFLATEGKADGFLAFKDGGVWFDQARTAGAPTVTAAGHASICTGATPSVHGIIANAYWDDTPGEMRLVESACDSKGAVIRTPGLLGSDPLSKTPDEGSSPGRLRIPALADVLAKRSGGASRTLAVSIKDRGTVYCGGNAPVGAYWHDAKSGSFVAGSYAGRAALPAWLDAFNKERARAAPAPWRPTFGLKKQNGILDPDSPDVEAYRAFLKDDVDRKTLESRSERSTDLGLSFPYRFDDTDKSKLTAFSRFQFSPGASDLLADLALAGLKAEGLGSQDGVTDLLTISFSSPDLAGHQFGSNGVEVFDTYLRLNATLARLRKGVTEAVGDEVVWALTADHGVQRFPEARRALGLDAGRFQSRGMAESLNKHLSQPHVLGAGEWVSAYYSDMTFLNKETMRAKGTPEAKVVSAAREFLLAQPGVKDVHTRESILRATSGEAYFYRRGYDLERSGALITQVKEGWTGDDSAVANHGSVYDDDARIPMAFMGYGIKKGKVVTGDARANDIAPTILALLGYSTGEKMNGTARAVEVKE